MILSTWSKNILIMHIQKVARALHRPKNILLYEKVSKGQVKIVFSWSSSATIIWLQPLSIKKVIVRLTCQYLKHLIHKI